MSMEAVFAGGGDIAKHLVQESKLFAQTDKRCGKIFLLFLVGMVGLQKFFPSLCCCLRSSKECVQRGQSRLEILACAIPRDFS